MIGQILNKFIGKDRFKKMNQVVLGINVKLYGKKALMIIDEEVKKVGAPYWLMFGTMLGAVREHNFIKNDSDIDLGMFSKDLTPTFIKHLQSRGFTYREVKMSSDKRLRMVKFFYHRIPIDFYGFAYDEPGSNKITGLLTKPLEGKNWQESLKTNTLRACLVHLEYEGTTDCDFNGITLKIPVNAHDFLRKHYGEDYLIPQVGNKGGASSVMEIMPLEKLSASLVSIDEL